MATSKKYLGMNIRRPTSVIESNIETTSNNQMSHLMPKRILSMHAANHINSQYSNHKQYLTQQQTKTYLPMKRSMLITPSVNTNKHSTASLNSSLNTNSSQNDLNHHKQQKHVPLNNDVCKQLSYKRQQQHKIEANQVDESISSSSSSDGDMSENEDLNEAKKREHETTILNKNKSKRELISIPTKRLVNPNNEISTTRLRQSFFMNEFPGQSLNKNHVNISNITNIQATFERYEPEERSAEEKSSSNSSKKTTNYANQPRYGANYTMKYTTTNSTNALPSKINIVDNSPEKNKPVGMRNTDSNNSSSKQSIVKSGVSLNRSMTDKNKSSNNQLSSIGNVSKSTSVKSGSYKNFILNHQRATAAALAAASTNISKQSINPAQSTENSINGSTQNCNQATPGNANNKYMTFTKSTNSSRNSYPAAATTASTTTPTGSVLHPPQRKEQKEEPEIDNSDKVDKSNSVLVDQMASFIDELKDFIDDRLIDTTSQLEMANQRISGLYYNLNYLTREFVELKIQNEELKNELQISNTISKNNSPVSSMTSQLAPPSFYQKLNESRRKFTKKSDTCEQIINSSSKTSSIETASSSTSESLAMSQNALASASQESQRVKSCSSDKPQQDNQEIRNLSRNEMILILKNQELNELNEKYNKLASSSSSVDSVDYDNMSIVNKLEGINWTDNNSVDQNQYLRTSSQIELNIVDGKYGSLEFEENEVNLDNEENEEEGENANENDELEENDVLAANEIIEEQTAKILNSHLRHSVEIEALNFENKLNRLKEADLRNSLKLSEHHHREAISSKQQQASCSSGGDVNSNKLMHNLHAPPIPYTNFRDFDTQYSWDYTDNLVNKFAGKLSASGLKN